MLLCSTIPRSVLYLTGKLPDNIKVPAAYAAERRNNSAVPILALPCFIYKHCVLFGCSRPYGLFNKDLFNGKKPSFPINTADVIRQRACSGKLLRGEIAHGVRYRPFQQPAYPRNGNSIQHFHPCIFAWVWLVHYYAFIVLSLHSYKVNCFCKILIFCFISCRHWLYLQSLIASYSQSAERSHSSALSVWPASRENALHIFRRIAQPVGSRRDRAGQSGWGHQKYVIFVCPSPPGDDDSFTWFASYSGLHR